MEESGSGRRRLMGCLTVTLVLLLLVGVVVPYGLRAYVRGRMGPAQLAAIERSRRPPQVPAEWARVEPVAPEVKAAAAALMAEWARRDQPGPAADPAATQADRRNLGEFNQIYRKLSDGGTLTDAERAEARRVLAEDRALLGVLVSLGTMPGYESSALDTPGGSVTPTNFFTVQTAVKAALMDARMDALDGQTSRALETATAALGMARRHPASTLITQLIAVAVSTMATKTIADIGEGCGDPAVLRAALARMDRLDAQVNAPMPEDIALADVLGNLRALKREGYPVDLDFSKPATHLFDQNLDAFMRYPEWKLKQLAPGDPLRAKYEQMVAQRGSKVSWFGPRQLIAYGGPYGGVVRDILMSIATPNFEEAAVRQKTAQARFDLARLALAERVAALEGGAPVAAARDLAPKYLSTTPADPFTSGAFARTAGAAFYSVGPDRQDGQGAPVYDPTNGTLSTGDILLSRK